MANRRRQNSRLIAGFSAILVAMAGFITFGLSGAALACGLGESCGGEGSFSGSMLVTEKGKVYSPGSDGGGSSGSDTEWSLRDLCEATNENGLCHGEPLECDPPYEQETIQSVRYMSSDRGWVSTGGWCPQDGKLHSIDDVANQVVANWEAKLPPLDPRMEPKKTRTLVDFKSYFHSGQPAGEWTSPTMTVWGLAIVVTAKPTWYWTFAPDSGEKSYTVPGSTHADKGPVNWTYKKADSYSPAVRVSWKGEMTINGQGPYEIEAPATQGPVELPITVLQKVSRNGDPTKN